MEKPNSKICPHCAAEYLDTLPQCPYCGTMNYQGAEAEYLNKLEDVRESLENLGEVPLEETKKELKRQGRFLKKLLLGLGISALLAAGLLLWMGREPKRDVQADYLWKKENFPIFDQLYGEEAYEELADRYMSALEGEQPFWDWEHAEFTSLLWDLFLVDTILDAEAQGQELSPYDYESLLYYGWKIQGAYVEDVLTADELERIEPYMERLRADFEARWDFTEEERAAFEREAQANFGYVSYDFCEKYVKSWLKEKD